MADIFISYSNEDASRIRPLAEALENQGWAVFWDRKIPPGKTWREVIGEALENARAVIVAWSKTSVKSRWVQEEADWGLKRNVLIPFFIEDVEPPLGFGSIQAANLTDWTGDSNHAGFQLLLGALSDLLGTARAKLPKPATAEPDFEKRRIDAVAPSNAALGQSLDVFVQVRFPDSEYLSIKDWPLKKKPSAIEQASRLTKVKYSKNSQGNLNPACLCIEIVAPEFKIEGESEKKIEIVPKEFSDLISFQLTPRSLGEQRIMVKAYDENGVSVGELPVETNVNDEKKPIVREANIVVLDLNVLVLVEPSSAETRTIGPSPPMAKAPRKSPATKMGILSALSLLIVAGTTWMFVQQKSGPRSTDVQPAPAPQPPVAARPSDPSPPKRVVNSAGMELVIIPAGSFTMGSSLGRQSEKPPHHVKISQPFYLQTTEVSQGQWKKVIGNNPSAFKECGDDCPVEQVSWDDANEFIKRLNVMESTDKYRLPTEAEWEYACRAEKTTEFSFGDDAGNLGEYAWYDGNSKEATQRVATKKPNPWGLYDMHGNVWEWVEDDWHDWYDGSPVGDQAWVDKSRGSNRVIRGGSWESVAFDCRSATRFGEKPGNRSFSLGFRVAKSP
jgi:formylglycine-generating enzyme required for sulfatase activity